MTVEELARLLALDMAFTKDFIALAYAGRMPEAIALVRRMGAVRMGRILGHGELLQLCEASIALCDEDIKTLELLERNGGANGD